MQGSLLRLVVAKTDPTELAAAIERLAPDVEVVSIGRRLEIVKQVGAPAGLDTDLRGLHVDRHARHRPHAAVHREPGRSEPLAAVLGPRRADLATVHNGHITNYHKLRRHYEQDGCGFYTENDSEVIGIYLARPLATGLSLADALRSRSGDLDGSFSYLAATDGRAGFVKDRFGFKPLIVAETDDFVAIATEEIALRRRCAADFEAREAPAGATAVWEVRRPYAGPTGASRAASRVR